VRQSVVRALLDAQIPVMGHLGLTPQSVMAFGGFRVQAKTTESAKLLIEDAQLLQDEGVFAIVIEGVPSVVGKSVTESLDIPHYWNWRWPGHRRAGARLSRPAGTGRTANRRSSCVSTPISVP